MDQRDCFSLSVFPATYQFRSGDHRKAKPCKTGIVSMSPIQTLNLLDQVKTKRIACVGDIMLDRFIYGGVRRVSPEAPIPILRKGEEREMLGAVGNVARNVASLGGQAVLIGVVGDDTEGRRLADLIGESEGMEGDLLPVRDRKTTLKTRFVAGGQQLLRVDVEDTQEISSSVEAELIDMLRGIIAECDAVLLSDYAKGTVTPGLIAAVNQIAKDHGKPVVADPKGRDFARYGNVDVLKPNASELALALNMKTDSDEDVLAAMMAAHEAYRAQAIVLTRSAKGMSFAQRGGPVQHVRARPLEVYDVSGAGDTSLAAIGLGLACGVPLADAVDLALNASSVAVTKVGTAAVYADEVRSFIRGQLAALDAPVKAISRDVAAQQVHDWRKAGRQVGFTNGCFDILHAGHVSLLQDARSRCDRLVLGLNSDASVQRLKGPTRPINSQDDRAAVLVGLECVDLVVIFDEDTPHALIQALRPDLLVKGGDYAIADIVGAQDVIGWGGEVYIAPLLEGRSTTGVIDKARQKQGE